MKFTKGLTVGIAVLGLVTLAPTLAEAEWFVDIYGGWANTQKENLTASHQTCGILGCGPISRASRDIDFDTTNPFGVRGGIFIPRFPWFGLAGDVSFFEATAPGVNVTVVPLSFLLMARLPLLTSKDFPNGRLQPYIGAGPTLLYQETSVDFRPALPEEVSGFSLEAGYDLRAGLAWQFHQRVALFGEYRITHFPIAVENEPLNLAGNDENIDTTLDTSHFQVGLSFRF